MVQGDAAQEIAGIYGVKLEGGDAGPGAYASSFDMGAGTPCYHFYCRHRVSALAKFIQCKRRHYYDYHAIGAHTATPF